jgi:hypothetical protein
MPEQEQNSSTCQCGNRLANTIHTTQKRRYNSGDVGGDMDPLGASFVHLSKPLFQYPAASDSIEYNHGFIAANNYAKALLSVAESWKESSSSANFLCGNCVSR